MYQYWLLIFPDIDPIIDLLIDIDIDQYCNHPPVLITDVLIDPVTDLLIGDWLTCPLRPLQVFPVHGLPDVAQVSLLVHEPAHEAVSVDAVEQDAGAVFRRSSGAARLQQRQVAARLLTARARAHLL